MQSFKFYSALLLNATNYSLIDLGNTIPDAILLQCRTAVDVLLSNDPTPAQAYMTLKAGSSLVIEPEGKPIGAQRGATKVTNGTFTGAATGWTLGTAWQYDTNKASKFQAGTTTLSQSTCAGVVDEVYEIVWTISSYATDTITASLGGVNGVARGADGTWKEYMKATATTALAFTPTNTNVCKVDDVAVYKLTGTSSLMLFAKAASGTPYLEISYLIPTM